MEREIEEGDMERDSMHRISETLVLIEFEKQLVSILIKNKILGLSFLHFKKDNIWFFGEYMQWRELPDYVDCDLLWLNMHSLHKFYFFLFKTFINAKDCVSKFENNFIGTFFCDKMSFVYKVWVRYLWTSKKINSSEYYYRNVA